MLHLSSVFVKFLSFSLFFCRFTLIILLCVFRAVGNFSLMLVQSSAWLYIYGTLSCKIFSLKKGGGQKPDNLKTEILKKVQLSAHFALLVQCLFKTFIWLMVEKVVRKSTFLLHDDYIIMFPFAKKILLSLFFNPHLTSYCSSDAIHERALKRSEITAWE